MWDKMNKSLTEQLRNDILNGLFSHDEKLTEAKLAAFYNVSRTPIREVIRKLESQYLIKEGYINIPGKEEYRNLFEMRILIESHSIKKAVRFFQQSDIDDMRRLIAVSKEKNYELIMDANQQFHEKIVDATRNPYLLSTYEQLNTVIYLFRKTVIEKERPGLIEEHDEIVNAIEERNEMKAEKLIVEHLEKDLEFGLYYIN